MESEKFSEQYPEVLRQLKLLYGKKIMDFEKKYKFDEFWGQTLKTSDFDAKPMVLLLGQYSVGKTSFIEYLLKRKFPGMRIGPEPTTDRFVAVMHGDEDQIIPGNALSVDPEQPFHGTNAFGSSFLSHFEASKCNASILKNITLVDSPGVLSGEKHRLGRSYDFTQVIQWFASKADLILLLFDGHKLDISDEFKEAIEALKGNDDKVRVVLNKCDQITTQQLMRVYGALMWSLGKVVKTPEVMRVYLGSFWDQPYRIKDNEKLFQMETKDLLEDLLSLPRNAAVRKVNELVKRVRLVRCHAYIISHLRDKMPMLFGKDDTKKDLIKNLAREFKEIERIHKIPPGDFPDVRKMQELLVVHDFSNFESRNERLFETIEAVMCVDLPKLMKTLAPQKAQLDTNPFASNNWAITDGMKQGYDELFRSLNPVNGCITGQVASKPLLECGVAMSDLRQIWELSDFEKDGTLDADEFALAMYLCQRVKSGETVPVELGPKLIPPSKRHRFKNINFNA